MERTVPSGRAAWRFLPAALAACLAIFVLGFGAGHGATGWLPFQQSAVEDDDGPEAWRNVVADYLQLTTSQTLTAMRPADAQLQAELVTVLARVGLKVPPAGLDLAGRRLMKVELYHYDGSPLAQITYLDEQNGPISLCVMPRGDKPEAPELERREGMNIAYWSSASHAFMLVGLAPQETLSEVASHLVPVLGSAG